jgi:hypothetical protein
MHDLQIAATRSFHSFHEHGWQTRSRHPTSQGVVRYQRCRCGSWRVLLGPRPAPAVQTGGRTTKRDPLSPKQSPGSIASCQRHDAR